MAQSYIPAGTDVICTEMTGGEPAQLGLTREAKVLYGKEKKPLQSFIIVGVAFILLLMCWFGVNYLPTAQMSVHTYTG